ncbi:Glycerol-1-phosphate phosphohydrolase 1 [Ceratocystis fimbriata CBS 114723]|uniref:Glycerol-1-phosphate phosphohydrolase 1 n=1 Tax=Ceratocystis fimbriata CBS 114723 TaxID=1035309 RepID=A0A2C5WWI4_9PEZI|nr:Glycerol-1-phosphate phosphohydrolase 1 [Ceratocystis fimbriata CBS 114723]
MPYTTKSAQATFDGFLFDMDGTIIDSTEAIVNHWKVVGEEIGISAEVILQTSHGRRSYDMFKIIKPEIASWDYVCEIEGRIPEKWGDSAVEIPGARDLINVLIKNGAPWAIVTSGTKPLVSGWTKRLNLPEPKVLVTAESVDNGKPDPQCYLMGREKLAMADTDKQILVLEDSPAGIRSGKAAGCKVVGLVTSHTAEQVAAAGPDWIVEDLKSVAVVKNENGAVTLEFSRLWKP